MIKRIIVFCILFLAVFLSIYLNKKDDISQDFPSDKAPSASFNKPNKVNMDMGEKVYLKDPDSVLVHEIMGHMGIEENKSQTMEYISLKKSQSDDVYVPSTSTLYKYQISEKISYLYQYLYEKNKHKLQKIGKNEK